MLQHVGSALPFHLALPCLPSTETLDSGLLMSCRALSACACAVLAVLLLGLSILMFAGKHRRFIVATVVEELRPVLKKSGVNATVGEPKLSGAQQAQHSQHVSAEDYLQDVGQISRLNRVIFVHVPKTGGTTIEESSLFRDARKFHATVGHSDAETLNLDASSSLEI